MSRVPGGFGINNVMGVQRPNRSVSVGQAWADALLARAQQGNPGVGGRPDPQVPGWASNIANSTAGQILGQPDLASQEAAFSGWIAQGASATPAAMMQQQRLAGGIDKVLDWVRPLALADFGVKGTTGSTMIPIPGGFAPGAAPAARTARKTGGGIAGALSQLLGRGGDEAVSAAAPAVREAVPVAQRTGRQTFDRVEDLEQAAVAAWPGGPTLYHGTSGDVAGGFVGRSAGGGNPLGGRAAMGEGLYTTPNMSFASGYADAGNQAAIKHAEAFGDVAPASVPGFVHNVRFTGEGAPVLLDYGAKGIDEKAKDAVMGSLDHLDDLLRNHSGTTPVSDRQRRSMQHWLDDPDVSFGVLHGYTDTAGSGSLRRTVEDVIDSNIRTGPFAEGQKAEMMSLVLENLSTRLRDAGYHGYVSPQGGAFQNTLIRQHGPRGEATGGMISWFTPERDLAIVGSGRYGS